MRHPLILLILFLLIAIASAETATITFYPALYVEDFGVGTPRIINNYTIESDQNAAGANWILLGTDDGELFDLVDSRMEVPFSAGVFERFNLSNTNDYRYYYFVAVSGFPIGTTLDIHFDNAAVAGTPKEQFTSPFNWTTKRADWQPEVHIFDFSKNPPGTAVNNYSITVDQNLAASQTWYLFGSNTLTIGDSTAVPTLIDTQTSESFSAGVTRFFDISASPNYNYYTLYIQGGFYVQGMEIEVAFNSAPVTPTPTPTPAPGANCTATFTANITEGLPPLGVQFNITGNSTIIDSASWFFGEGNTSVELNPFHLYEVYGRWNVGVTYQNTTYGDVCTVTKDRYIHIIEPERVTYISPTIFVSLLLFVFGGFVYSVYDNKNRYYGNIIIGMVVTVIAFYLALAAMNGSIMEPVNILSGTNHTVLNGTVSTDVNLSINTWYSSSHTSYQITYSSGILGWFLVMTGLIIGLITSFNILEVVLTFKEKTWR